MADECKGCAVLRQYHQTAWNRGFVMGKASNANAAYAASNALEAERKAHAETNVTLTAEITRLEAQLAQANVQTEEFERKFYLKSDECEKLQAAIDGAQGEQPPDDDERQFIRSACNYWK